MSFFVCIYVLSVLFCVFKKRVLLVEEVNTGMKRLSNISSHILQKREEVSDWKESIENMLLFRINNPNLIIKKNIFLNITNRKIRREFANNHGGRESVERQKKVGKMVARERFVKQI